MNQVLLINKVARGTMFPVCGISGKLYGRAFLNPELGGMVFEMSAEEYERNKFDIIGQRRHQQQWVPKFVGDNGQIKEPSHHAKHRRSRCGWPELRKRAKAAGVFKRGMTEKEALTALGLG